MKVYYIDCTNVYRKLEWSLRKYNIDAYKKLCFEYYPDLRHGKFDGELLEENKREHIKKYEIILPSDKMFVRVHGEVKLIYTVHEKEETVILEKITPERIWFEGHNSGLHKYKGVLIPSSDAMKYKFLVDLLNKF